MKKVFLSLAVVSLFALASCDKEKTCECTTSTAGLGDIVQEVVIPEGKCSDMDAEVENMGIVVTTVCVEK